LTFESEREVEENGADHGCCLVAGCAMKMSQKNLKKSASFRQEISRTFQIHPNPTLAHLH
jgi:hypothetical protein